MGNGDTAAAIVVIAILVYSLGSHAYLLIGTMDDKTVTVDDKWVAVS